MKHILISQEMHDKLKIKAIHHGCNLQEMAHRVLKKALK